MSMNDSPEDWDALPLTSEHVAKLKAAAITPAVAKEKGLRSITSVDQLPEWAAWAGEKAVPAILFPWIDIHGTVTEQLRPEEEFEHNGEQYKYLVPKGSGAVLNALRHDPDAEKMLLVEGTKQGLAAASYAPEGVAIYGVGGCRNWSSDGIPDTDLEVCEGKQVFILLDADVTSNRDVYDAAMKLRRAAKQENAKSVAYCILPAGGTNGLDDVIGKRPENKRTPYIEGLMREAVAKEKPCSRAPDAKPKKRASSGEARPVAANDGSDRPIIYVDGDRFEVINEITDRLLDRWDGTRLFSHGELISQLVDEGEGPKMKPLTEADGTFYDVLQETAATAYQVLDGDGEQVGLRYAWPDSQSVKAVRSRSTRFSKLEVIARSPFVRVDGSVCLSNGYDSASKTMVVMDEVLTDLDVPGSPTPEEVAAAVNLLLTEWLGDFPFPDQENKANALALVLTPFVRGLMDVAPLAVIDAHTPGTGKNLLVDCILLMFLGERPHMLPFNPNDDEFRKLLTSAFLEGSEVFVFDEAHHLEGASLARALTASHWKDRNLGFNQMLGFPNRITWISLGNNVRVEGDIFRRVYRVALRSPYEHPEDRPETDYRHPDLKEWTQQNRPALLRAALTLVRAWFSAGQPKPSEGVAFGGFERFARTLGGILETAGVDGFLGNLKAWRSESNFGSSYWESHLRWLVGQFGTAEFTASAVRTKLINTQDPAYPPIKGDIEDKASYPKALGEAYAKNRDRSYGGLRLRRPVDEKGAPRRDGVGRALWVVQQSEPPSGTQEKGGGPGPVSPTETSETSETPTPHAPKENFIFSTGAGRESQKIKSPRTGAGVGSLGSLGSLRETAPSGPAVPNRRRTGPVSASLAPNNPVVTGTPFSALLPGEKPPQPCPHCRGQKRLVPPSNFWYACPSCFPATFGV